MLYKLNLVLCKPSSTSNSSSSGWEGGEGRVGLSGGVGGSGLHQESVMAFVWHDHTTFVRTCLDRYPGSHVHL